MNKNKLNSKGFTISGILVLVVVAGLISVAGWLVYNKRETQTATQVKAPAYITATDSTGKFSFQYPENWTLKPFVWKGGGDGPVMKEPDWSKESKPITLHPPGNEKAEVILVMEEYGNIRASYSDLKSSVHEDNFAKVLFEGKREDGHEALFARVDYLGPPDAKVESFTDHRYYFDNDKSYLRVEFREKYHHDWPDEETGPDINNSQYLSDFERIAKSVKFSN